MSPRGRKPLPTALRRANGNPGKRGYNAAEPMPPEGLPDCPPHLGEEAREEWHRLAKVLHGMGVLTVVDRAALAAYCQSWARWVEAEERLRDSPVLLKTPSGYVQQNPWLSIANKQLELMGRYMVELGITPASRSRLTSHAAVPPPQVTFTVIYEDGAGTQGDQRGALQGDAARGLIRAGGTVQDQ